MEKIEQITWNDFEKVEIRVGKIIEIEDFQEAKKPSYRLKIDFGSEIGIKKSCAQATNYSKEELMGRRVICVINFPPKQIANAISEVLVLGARTEKHGTALLMPEKEAVVGTKIF
ncbi:MAG: tRNA-binding protein [Candidatus Micrarchaeota archaeon]